MIVHEIKYTLNFYNDNDFTFNSLYVPFAQFLLLLIEIEN